MRALIALLTFLWLPHAALAQSTLPPPTAPTPCLSPTDPVCRSLQITGVVRRKDFFDPLLAGAPVLSLPFAIPKGAAGILDSVVVDQQVMYRVRVDKVSAAGVVALVLDMPDTQQAWGWLMNAAGDQPALWALQNLARPTLVNLVFAQPLAPGQASNWIVDTDFSTRFTRFAVAQVVDTRRQISAPQAVLAGAP